MCTRVVQASHTRRTREYYKKTIARIKNVMEKNLN